jgi:hypothetical protein
MFRSKSSSQPQQPWAMSALTLNYLIEGSIQPSDELNLLLAGASGYYENRYVVTLTNASVQPAGNLTTQPLYVSHWTVEHRGLVALIPRDEASTQALLKNTQSRSLAFQAVMYVGSYVIRATLASPSPSLSYETYAFMPVKDAEINCQLPGARLVGYKVPWMVVNRELWQGYHPA